MKKLFFLSAVAVALNAHAAEFFVDPAKGDDANAGTVAAPFRTIRAAIKAAAPTGGDTITLRGGVYRENIALKTGITATVEKPFVIQGAAGERVIVTGFEPITGWAAAGDGVYTAEVPELVNGLFVGLEAQPLARWPRTTSEWLPFGEGDSNTVSFAVLSGLDKAPDEIKAIASTPRSAQMYAFVRQPDAYSTYPIKSLDLEKGRIFVGMQRWWPIYTGGGKDTFVIQNHPLLIKSAGEWACAAKEDGGKAHTVYFKPKNAQDLGTVFYRTRGSIVYLREVTGVVIRNLEISGAGGTGIETWETKDCVIESCTVHNSFNYGISVRKSRDMIIRSNIVIANEDSGISVASTDSALVEGNEVCFNMVDGVRVIGNVSGRPGTEPDSTNVTVRRNYVHHHCYLSHPDNMQMFRGASRVKIEDNLFLFGGQNTMTEEACDSEMRGNVSLFTSAFIVIFGHKNAHRWTATGNTFGYGGWGSIAMDGERYAFFDNLFIGTGLNILPNETTSDHNVFLTRPYAPTILRVGYKEHTDIAKAREATQTDAHSLAFPDVPFANMPKAFSLYEHTDDPGKLARADYLVFRTRGKSPTAKAPDFTAGDNIEINGDGIMRNVTAVDSKGITFTPPLPQLPFRDAFILNWGNSKSTTPDLSVDAAHPMMTAARDGKRAGSALDIAAIQRGELLANGKRTLPPLPDDLKAAWPNPNRYTPPMYGR